jgi:hypothetical protein
MPLVFFMSCGDLLFRWLYKIPGHVTGDFFRGILPVHVPGVDSAFRNEYQDIPDNPTTLMCRLSRNPGALNSRTPQGHVGLFRGLLYLAALKVMFKLVYLNRLVTLRTSGLWFVKVIHFFFVCVCVDEFLVLCNSMSFKLWIMCNGKTMNLALDRIMFHSCSLHLSVICKAVILLM